MAKKKMTLEEKLEEAIVKDAPYEVPENWVWSRLESIATLVTGNTPSKKKLEYYGGNIPFIKPNDLGQGRRLQSSTEMLSNLGAKKARILPLGSTAVCCIGSIGKSAYLEVEGATNQQINSIIPNKVNNLYIYYYVLSNYFQTELVNNSSATTISIINKSKMGELTVPLPPLREQQRIVDRIESLFEKLDKSKELIEEARDGFEKRKKTLMAKGISGELINKEFDNNVCINDIIIEINSGFACSKQYEILKEQEGAYPHLRPNNVGYYNMFNLDKIVYIPFEKVQAGKELIKKGDIIFNNTNSTELVGRAVVATKDMEVAFSNHLTKIIVDKNKVSPEWVTYCLNSLWAKGFFTQICKQWVGQSGVNQNVLKQEVYISLPSLEEQIEIVRILDKLLGDESKIEELTKLEEQIELIKKSILAKAFRGELGTNCEEDESALELLKEILRKDL